MTIPWSLVFHVLLLFLPSSQCFSADTSLPSLGSLVHFVKSHRTPFVDHNPCNKLLAIIYGRNVRRECKTRICKADSGQSKSFQYISGSPLKFFASEHGGPSERCTLSPARLFFILLASSAGLYHTELSSESPMVGVQGCDRRFQLLWVSMVAAGTQTMY